MSIKKTYTVKQGDRISYIASWEKVTIQEIVDANPQVFTKYRMSESDRLIAEGTINQGELLLYKGDVLNIPTGELKGIADDQTLTADVSGDFAILIDNKKCPIPVDFLYNEYFDACSDSFNIVYPHDNDAKYPIYKIDPVNFKTKGLSGITLYIASELVLTGEIETIVNAVAVQSSAQTIAGRSKTYLLEKSDIFPSIQREFLNLNMKQIADIVCRPYSIKVTLDSSVAVGESFSKIDIAERETPFDFLNRVVMQRGAIVTKNANGECLITKQVDSQPVANFAIDSSFLKFIGVEQLNFTFDSTKVYGAYIGKTQSTDDPDLEETVQSKILKQQSIKIINFSDATSVNLKNLTEWEEQKTVREFYNNEIPYPSWINPNTGKRWKTGQIITVKSKEAGIMEPVRMMIKEIQFKASGSDIRVATLKLLPMAVYL